MTRLVQEFGAHAGRQLSLDKDTVRLGRAPDNDVVFDPNVDLDASGHHCEIVREQGGWFVADSNSRNGTWINGVRVQRQRLSHGDLIECGKGGPRLRVEEAPMAGATAAASPFVGVSTAPAAQAFPPPSAVPGPFGGLTPGGAPPPARPSIPAPPASGHGATVAMEGFSASLSQGGTPQPPSGIPMGLPMNSAASGFPPPGYPPPGALGYPPPPMGMPAMGSAPPGAQPSVGQAMVAGIPTGAPVGHRTMALMIDRALAQADKRRGSGAGLKVMVGLLTLLVLGSLAIGGYLLSDDDNRHTGGGVSLSDPSTAGARLAEANEANIYMLAVSNGLRDRGFCTAFAVTRDLLATNAHCVAAARREAEAGGHILALRNKSPGIRIAVSELWSDPRYQDRQFSNGGSGYDVGLARVGATLNGAVRLADNRELYALHEGDAIFVYGFPGMTMNETSPVATITLGLVNRLTDFFDRVAVPADAQKVQHSAQTSGGSSGSPIFSPSGSVVGINAGSLADEEHQTVYDPATRSQHEVEVNRGSNFKYGMRADLIRAGIIAVGEHPP